MSQKFLSDVTLSTVTGGSMLKLDANGKIVAAVDGTDYISTSASSLWSIASGGIFYSDDVRIGTYQSDVAPDAKLHVFDYQTTTPKLLIEDGNTGDASMEFKISTQSFTMGIDNSDSDKFVIAASSALGTTNVLEISTTGLSAFQNSVLFNDDVYIDSANIFFDANGKSFRFDHDGDRDLYQVTYNGTTQMFLRAVDNVNLQWEDINQAPILKLNQDRTIELGGYGAGLLKTDANGNVSLDTNSYALSSHTHSQYLRSDADDTATGTVTFSGTVNLNAAVNFNGVNGQNFTVNTDSQRIIWDYQRNGTRRMSFYHETNQDTFNFSFQSGANLQINGNRILTTNDSSSFAAATHTHTLSEITDAGTAAAADTTDFATAAQGALADTALQSLPSHNHDTRYYTKQQSDNQYATNGNNLIPINATDSNYQLFTEEVVLASVNEYRGLAFQNGGKNFVFEVSIKGTNGANHQGIFWGLDQPTEVIGTERTGYKLTHQGEGQFHIRDIATNTTQITSQDVLYAPNDGQYHRYKIINYTDATSGRTVFKVYVDGNLIFNDNSGAFNTPPQQPTYFGFINYNGDVTFSNWNIREITGEQDIILLVGDEVFQPVGDYLTSLPAHHHDARYYTETEMDTFLAGKLPLSGGTMTGDLQWDTSAATTNTHAKITFGQSPNPDGSLNGMAQVANYGADGYGLLLHVGYGDSDNGGIKITDDGVIVWGASDENVFTVIDEDSRTERFRIDNSGNITASGTLTASGYNKSNWDTAYSWGNHASQGYLTSLPSHNHDGRYMLIGGDGGLFNDVIDVVAEDVILGFNNYTNAPYPNHSIVTTYVNQASAGRRAQFFHADSPAGGLWWRARQGDSTGWHDWQKVWTSYNFDPTTFLTSSDLTGYATESYVNTAVSNLVDSAPTTLDTLNELAAALGDDPNFATSVSTSIGTKVSKAGDTMTGSLTIDTGTNGSTTQAYTAFDRIIFNNQYNDVARGANKIVLYDDGASWMGGFGIHDDTVAYYSGGTHKWYKVNSNSTYTERMTLDASGNLSIDGTLTASGYNKSNWDTAYGWGNHSDAGYLTSVPSTFSATQITLGSGVVLKESTDRADLLSISSSTSGWGGLQVTNSSNEALGSFMVNGSSLGLYDDQQSEWIMLYTENGGIQFFNNGDAKLTTNSTGINVVGNVTVSGTVDGIDIAAGAANWNTAYGWGDHAGLYLGVNAKAADSNLLDGLDSSVFMRKSANSVLDMNNFNIQEVNHITFNDSGFGEGLQWQNWLISDAPDNLSNAAGNLQISSTADPTIRVTVDGNGNFYPSRDRLHLLGLDTNRWQIVFCEILDSAGQHEKNLQNPEGEKSVGEYETGTVLVWKGGKNVPCTTAADHMRMGIAVKGMDSPLIQGAEPVLVTGVVKEGDYLVTSSKKEGHAEAISPEFMRQHNLFDCVLGKALESAEGESHLVKTWINI